MFDLLITGGTVVMPSEAAEVDIGVQDGRIVAIGAPGTLIDDAVEVVDATGRIVCPGGIEPHVHAAANVQPGAHQQVVGVPNAGPLEHSLGAIWGGTTTVVDFAPAPNEGELVGGVLDFMSVWEGNTYTDYEFPDAAYEILAWTFLPAVDPPQSLSDKGLLHYYAYNFGLVNRSPSIGYGYAGFQTDGHLGGNRLGKAVNFSVWGSNAARSDGLINPNNEECGCHQIMLQYKWVEGRKYRFELRTGPGGVEAEGKWWGLWVTDLATDSTSFVGEQRVPATIGGRPSTMWEPRTSVFGEDLHWWRSRNGSERFICSDFEASSLAVLDVTAGPDEDRPVSVRPWTNSGKLDVAENGYETTLCYVTVFRDGNDTQHNVGFWPEPPDNVLADGHARIRR